MKNTKRSTSLVSEGCRLLCCDQDPLARKKGLRAEIAEITDGTVTLIGVVDTLRERRMATENAYEGGAKHVRNELKVRYGPEALRP